MKSLNAEIDNKLSIFKHVPGTTQSGWHDHNVVTFNGSYDTQKDTGRDYKTRTLRDIFEADTPANVDKKSAPAFIPSSYHKFDARSHEVQRAQGSFVCNTGDIDKGNHSLGEVTDLVEVFTGPGTAFKIYSSSSATPEDKKWRVLIPLAEVVSFQTWQDMQCALVKWMAANDVELDTALTRAGQPVFLPNVPPTKRGENGEPLFYETHSVDGFGFDLQRSEVAAQWVASTVVTREKPASNTTKTRATTTRNADQVLDALASYRGEWTKTPDEAAAALKLTARRSPSKGLAKALDLLVNGDEKSEGDYFILCEAYRRGIDAYQDAAELLVMLAGPNGREKAKEKEYQAYRTRTAESAARAVLTEIESNAFNRLNYRLWEHLPDQDKATTARPLPEGVAAALAETGDSLIYGKAGRVEATPGNVKTILTTDPKVKGLIAFNESSQNIERTGPWTVFDRHATTKTGVLQDSDIDFVGAWLHRAYGINMKKAEVMQGMDMASRAQSFDPVGDSLHRLGAAWDGQPRAARWLQDFAMVDDTEASDYVTAAGLCFLVGAVARALDPGCKFDTVLTIEGEGGGGKSTLFQVLSDAVGPDLFTDGIHDVTNPQHRVEITEGKFIVEIAELAGFRRAADQESLKTVLSQTRDKVRKPYAIRPVEILRRYVFAATTNNDQYYTDPKAMGRRFLPVKTTATRRNPIDRVALAEVAPQLWGEAVHLYKNGYAPFIAQGCKAFDQWEEQGGQRQETLPFEDEVNDLMIQICTNQAQAYDHGYGITRKAAAKAIGLDDFAQADQRTMDRLTGTMKAKGFERQRKFAGTYPWKLAPAGFMAAHKMNAERAKLA